MTNLRFTLLSDGSSDRALIPLLTWCLRQRLPACAFQSEWADLGRLPQPPHDLSSRIRMAVDLYPCHLLFVHRDAENQKSDRYAEIKASVLSLGAGFSTAFVCVVPVRMTEAWFTFDEMAIRRAAGNPNGTHPLNMPRVSSLETLPDPKQVLHDLLRAASDLGGRHLDRFNARAAVHRVAELIENFSPLARLPAFASMCSELDETVTTLTAQEC
jgi:hypothetical protein